MIDHITWPHSLKTRLITIFAMQLVDLKGKRYRKLLLSKIIANKEVKLYFSKMRGSVTGQNNRQCCSMI